MNQSIHSLVSSGVSSNQKHQLHHQLHHTLQPPQQQQQHSPLVNPQTQTMLQFHQTLHHPYSTLSQHQLQMHQQQQANSHQNTMLFGQTLALQQQQQQQQQHQQQYNMNSDYSSSNSYHIYDQISDLIIIKQQRMERKRQQEHRRKVILLSLAAILLVGTLMFLLIQTFFTSSSSSSSSASAASSQLSQSRSSGQEQQQLLDLPIISKAAQPASSWPSLGDHFDGAKMRFPSANSNKMLPPQLTNINNQQQQQPPSNNDLCNQHGTVISSDSSSQLLCKCDSGFWGSNCEFGATYQAPSNQLQMIVRCQLTNCNGNGQCNSNGRCICYQGFLGPNCEFKTPQTQQQQTISQQTQVIAPTQSNSESSSSGSSNRCALNNCNGNGQCTSNQGKCKCFAGFLGDSCQERDLCFGQSCSNQGNCIQATGECQCKFGFKGTQCEIRDDQLWQKLFNCSNHGKFDFQQRKCICDQGFGGFDCGEERCDLRNGQKPLDCGSNGLYDCRQNKCICQDGYSGELCQIQQCSAQCLRNGQCVDGACVCQIGFYGKHCSLNGCPNQCSGRGQCVRLPEQTTSGGGIIAQQQQQQQQHQAEWRCQCQVGATGDDCGLLVEKQCDDGIDNDKDGLVDCADSECCGDKVCQNSTLCMKAPDPLDILMRKQPPPPTSSFFQRMQFLIEKHSSQIYSNPKDFNDSILMSKYADRASVIRGKVTYLKQGITGVRVSVAGQINLGITLTRDGGYFDLMVNGGGAVVIEFRREPFATQQKAVRVPWNEIVLMESIELALEQTNSDSMMIISTQQQQQTIQSPLPEPDSPSCLAHNYRLMRPQIVAAPRSTRRSSRSKLASAQQTSRAVILRDSGMVQQSILLPGSSSKDHSATLSGGGETNQSVSLVYISSRANEFMSTISLQLTPSSADSNFKLPPELKLIHLKIVIEGNLFEQLFEPQTNLSFTYAWNRRNVYRQKSFGLSTASVSVGYEYFDCKHVIWSTKLIQLPGHDLSISDIGNQWNLNIHHRYNYRDSILQRGDGQNFNLKTDKARVVQPIIGDGYQRQATCPYCDGATSVAEQRLLKPQALVSAPDGSIYVGDFNLIRRIEWAPSEGRQGVGSDRIMRTVLELPTSRTPNSYSLGLNLADNKLYMSDAERYQVFLIREQGKQQVQLSSADQQATLNETIGNGSQQQSSLNLEENLIPLVGNGLRCELDDRSNCGDGQAARGARLIEPKALAFDLNGRMYIADGPNVRLVDTDQKIYTILGDYGATRHTKFPCSGEAIPMHKFVPKSPLDLAMSPIDDTLHLLDDNVVYKITQDKRVQIVAGRLAHCLSSSSSANEPSSSTSSRVKQPKATEVFLQSAQSIAFNQNGDLFISEDDQKQMISRILLVSPEEDTISLYAGLPVDTKSTSSLVPTMDSVHSVNMQFAASDSDPETQDDKQRSSNVLPLNQATRALDYKFNSVAAIAVDQQGKLIVADKLQLRLLSVEADLPQINAAGEYELQSPDNGDELLVFNRFGHHIATRDISSSQAQRNANKYNFSYNVNTSFGQLASVSYASGNKISIYRDGPHHSVKMIETAFGGQCKLEVTRHGQVHSISTIAPNTTKTNFAYQVDGGLLKQSRDQASGEMFDFTYDEFGRATGIQHSSPKLPAPVECRTQAISSSSTSTSTRSSSNSSYMSQLCSALIVAE